MTVTVYGLNSYGPITYRDAGLYPFPFMSSIMSLELPYLVLNDANQSPPPNAIGNLSMYPTHFDDMVPRRNTTTQQMYFNHILEKHKLLFLACFKRYSTY